MTNAIRIHTGVFKNIEMFECRFSGDTRVGKYRNIGFATWASAQRHGNTLRSSAGDLVP